MEFLTVLILVASVSTVVLCGAALLWFLALLIVFCCLIVATALALAAAMTKRAYVSLRGPREELVCVAYYFD